MAYTLWPGHTHAVEQVSEDAVFEAIRAAVDAGEYIGHDHRW